MNKEKIEELSKAASSLSKWDSSGECFGYFNSLSTYKPDRIYEFLCMMKILEDLSHKNNIKIISRDKSKNLKFPKSPGKKINYSYFIIESKEDLKKKYQLCLGTEVLLSDAPDSPIAPDITFQNIESTDAPNESMVEMVFDAKYKYDDDDKFSVSEIREFCQIVSDLKVQDASTKDFRFDKLKDFNSNCLITNGNVFEKHEAYCIQRKVRQIGKFEINEKFIVVG